MGSTRDTGQHHAFLRDRRFILAVQAFALGTFVAGVAAIAAVQYSWPHPVVLAIAIGLIVAALVAIIGVVDWRRHPDLMHVKAEVDSWMQAGTLPDTVVLGTALPLIAERIARNTSDLWRSAILLAFYGGEIALQASDDRVDATRIAFFSLAAIYGIAYLGRTVSYRIRWIPVLRRLLRDGQRRFAAPPLSQD